MRRKMTLQPYTRDQIENPMFPLVPLRMVVYMDSVTRDEALTWSNTQPETHASRHQQEQDGIESRLARQFHFRSHCSMASPL